jgi:hypothetical protein
MATLSRKASSWLLMRLLVLGGSLFLLEPSGTRGDGPFKFYALNPCRILDTRISPGVPLNFGPRYDYAVVGLCGVPRSAKAVFLNPAVISPSAGVYLVLYPYPGPAPPTSNINADAGERAIANGSIVMLGTDSSFQISAVYGAATGGTADLVLDVMGYFQ